VVVPRRPGAVFTHPPIRRAQRHGTWLAPICLRGGPRIMKRLIAVTAVLATLLLTLSPVAIVLTLRGAAGIPVWAGWQKRG
jgi:hypothetical protein